MKKYIALVGSALLLLAFASVAFAHAQITSCTPEIGSTVATPPATVTCKAAEAMDPKASSLSVFDASGMQVDKKDSAVDLNDPDRVTISVSLDTTMMKDGLYTVKWMTLSSADSDSADGEFQFAVGAQPIKIGPTATAAPQTGTSATPLPAGTIKIVSPADKSTITAGPVEVKIVLKVVELGDVYHWHIALDNNMLSMITNKSDTTTIDVPAGEHDIKVSLADATHDELASDMIHVTAQGTSSGAQATAAPTEAMQMGTETPAAGATAEMQMGTETPAAGATAAMDMGTATPAATAVAPTGAALTPTPVPSTTLPQTGDSVNYGLFALVAVLGVMLFVAGTVLVRRGTR